MWRCGTGQAQDRVSGGVRTKTGQDGGSVKDVLAAALGRTRSERSDDGRKHKRTFWFKIPSEHRDDSTDVSHDTSTCSETCLSVCTEAQRGHVLVRHTKQFPVKNKNNLTKKRSIVTRFVWAPETFCPFRASVVFHLVWSITTVTEKLSEKNVTIITLKK